MGEHARHDYSAIAGKRAAFVRIESRGEEEDRGKEEPRICLGRMGRIR